MRRPRINTAAGLVFTKTMKEVLNELPRKMYACGDEFYHNVMIPNQTLGSTISENDGPQEFSYIRKSTKIEMPADFKDMKKKFAKRLLEETQYFGENKDYETYSTIQEDNKIKIKPNELFHRIEDASMRLAMNFMTDPLVLFPVKPRTWCLLSLEAWEMVFAIKGFEGKLIGAAPNSTKTGSWVIIEVERG